MDAVIAFLEEGTARARQHDEGVDKALGRATAVLELATDRLRSALDGVR